MKGILYFFFKGRAQKIKELGKPRNVQFQRNSKEQIYNFSKRTVIFDNITDSKLNIVEKILTQVQWISLYKLKRKDLIRREERSPKINCTISEN